MALKDKRAAMFSLLHLRLLKYKMADQMETEHLGHQQMLPRGHLAHSQLSAITSPIMAKPVQHM